MVVLSPAPTSSPSAHSNNNSSRISWLAVHLVARGMAPGQVAACASAFIEAEGFTTEASLALLPPEEFTLQYLRSVGISGKGTAMQLIALHRELHAQNETSPAAPLPHLSLLKALLLDLVLIVIALSL